MATTHVFIVDKNTFKYHLEYLFVGTGSKNNIVDFNDNEDCGVHYAIENSLVGLIADFERIRIGDFAIFYVQGGQNFEGKFYGLFKICSEPFIDHNDENQFLKSDLGKSLTFRAKIEAFHVLLQWDNGMGSIR